MYYKKEFGYEGETKACNYLENNEYDIIERNFSCKSGEIDIIAYDKKEDEIVFVEVKSRQQIKYGQPAEAVDLPKINHIRRTAEYYAYIKGLENSKFRFDVIEIKNLPNNKTRLHHIIQAFDFDQGDNNDRYRQQHKDYRPR